MESQVKPCLTEKLNLEIVYIKYMFLRSSGRKKEGLDNGHIADGNFVT